MDGQLALEGGMAAYDFAAPRLFRTDDLASEARLPLERGQANYLLNVLRLRDGDPVLVFNGRDGEWRASSRRGPPGRTPDRPRAAAGAGRRRPTSSTCSRP